MFYVYGLSDPRNNQLRYVGFTFDLKERLHKHMQPSKISGKNHRSCWLRQLKALKIKPEMFVLETYDTKQEAAQAEIELIAYYKYIGCDLVNGTLGGDGGDTRSGKSQTIEEIAKRIKTLLSKYADTETHKQCRRCAEIKIRDLFPKDIGSFDGYRGECKSCANARNCMDYSRRNKK